MQERGFTLLELLITVAIVAILASIALPAYNSFAERARRTEGKTALLQAAQGLERCFTRFGTYNNASCDTANALGGGFNSESNYYTITGNVQATTYALLATGLGAQAGDTDCGNFGLNELGQKTFTGTSDLESCWGR